MNWFEYDKELRHKRDKNILNSKEKSLVALD